MISLTSNSNSDDCNKFCIYFDNSVKSEKHIKYLLDQSIKNEASGVTILLGSEYLSDCNLLDQYLTNSDIPITGGIFNEVIHKDSYYKDAVIVIAWKTDIEVNTFHNISDFTSELYQQVEYKEEKIQNDKNGCLVFVDSRTRSAEEALDALYYRSENDFQYAGAGAGYSFDKQLPCIICNKGIIKDALQTIKLSLRQEIKVSRGWNVLSGPHLVTSSTKNKVATLDYLPIESQYREFIQKSITENISQKSIEELIEKYPIGIYHYDEDIIVRKPYKNTHNEIEFFGDIPEFSNIYILEAEPERLIEDVKKSFKHFNQKVIKSKKTMSLLFSCLARRSHLGSESNNELKEAYKQLGTDHTFIGTTAFGEIATNQAGLVRFHTMSLIVSSVY